MGVLEKGPRKPRSFLWLLDVGTVLKRDSDAFVAEMVRHQQRLHVFIASLLPNPSDVDDVFQQTCMAMWKKRAEIADLRDFLPLACGFAKNEALHVIRRNARKGAVALNERLLATLADEFEREGNHSGYLDALGGCLEKLQVGQRELLQRRYAGLETLKEIAAELRVSAAALTMRLQRIRRALVNCVEKSIASAGGGA